MLALAGFLLFAPRSSLALENPEVGLAPVGMDPGILGSTVDLGLAFTDSTGVTKPLRDFIMPEKPLIITPVYFRCPRLCGLFLSSFITLLQELGLSVGEDFTVLTVSFDPTETPSDAAKEREEYLAQAPNRALAEKGWHFFTGQPADIETLMRQVGFRYAKDGTEYAHTAAFMILTPQGEVSQYFTGIDYPAWDVKLALVEAGKGTIGSAFDHVLLYCFRFDPTKGKYTWAAFNFMRAGVILTVLSIAAFAVWAVRR